MTNIFLDIETIPTQRPGTLERIRADITPPGNITKPESISKWMTENADAAAEETYRKTALSGTLGEVVCICYALDDGPVQSFCRMSLGVPESDLLRDFFASLDPREQYRYIGHNVMAFDLRFLFQRAVINGVRPVCPLPHDTRYNGDLVYDTMLAWSGWGNRIKLSSLCEALGIQVKSGGLDGSMVWDFVQAGRVSEVVDYCEEDVEAVRDVYRRMTFSMPVV